jgi:hypothetical protein
MVRICTGSLADVCRLLPALLSLAGIDALGGGALGYGPSVPEADGPWYCSPPPPCCFTSRAGKSSVMPQVCLFQETT